MDKHVFEIEINNKPMKVEIGEVAKQANGAVVVRYGDTTVLSAAVGSSEAGQGDFFPLTINYNEKLYAAGKVPGGFLKREGKPSEHATLTARLIDRPIRPLFPEGYRNEVQVTNTVLSVDPDCSPEVAAMLGSSLALGVSDIPFEGPIAGVNVGRVDGELIICPTIEQKEKSDLDITVAGTAQAINMVESGANEISEEEILAGLMAGHAEVQRLCAFQSEIIKEIGKEKMIPEILTVSQELKAEINEKIAAEMRAAILTEEKLAREENIANLKAEYVEAYTNKFTEAELTADEINEKITEVKAILEDLEKQIVRELITVDKIRPDGRKVDEIRPLDAQVDYLPRVHGSGLFTRGQTQALSVLTLGQLSEHQIIDDLGVVESKRFLHHYNFPQFCVGGTGRNGAPGRREIGHGALGERALLPVIPDEETFPYTIRLVAEVLESNGSSSQASICASTLALMAGGVPIKAPVAGIAMGLVKENDDYTILTDIQGLEDHLGDMDFKVAGTTAGITALQMDIKTDGITREILEEALAQAKKARLQILDVITTTIPKYRDELSEYAPKIDVIKIDKDKIKVVIGKGGETINKIIDETGVTIDIDEDGTVRIASSDQAAITRAKEIIEVLTKEVKVGEIYDAKVVRIEKFGAFVQVLPGKQALVHISQLSNERVKDVESVVSIGDTLQVKITEIDRQNRINASHKVLLTQEETKEVQVETKKEEPKKEKPAGKGFVIKQRD
ncbi:polyribonucleotide nucleotidyltransferase [Ligilactobacillus ceti]|uniref:Polyribonucleotide nucleotidyltransferase n=1 Tax=Ligilactobacillus ceti DSM 22408 TaxID=1122146 RepID=A0A0R2KS52_9LACO|nr:polyribonucleotide nucleotidyltransferase [Ligilactobacillus ceti]KRN88916.1 polynucleotide phosphorylase [Ligilactobacillus ceti DSM 22408]